MIKKSPFKTSFLTISLLLLFCGLELPTATPLAPFPTNVRYNTNQVKNHNSSASDLCLLKNHVNQAKYYYKKPYFFSTGGYKGYNTSLLFLQKPTGLFYKSKRGIFQLIGIEANLHLLKADKGFVEWYEYKPHRNGPDLSRLCLPQLNKGKCLFKVVYRGKDMKLDYTNTSTFAVGKGLTIKAQVYSARKALVFPENCN